MDELLQGGTFMPTEKPRYTITLDEDMLKRIDNFRFENRNANRTQATLALIRIGLDFVEQRPDEEETGSEER